MTDDPTDAGGAAGDDPTDGGATGGEAVPRPAANEPPTERLALFPLGTVLLPGLLLPLQIFEPRYRELVGELLELPDDAPRQFGVVAIKLGREVGAQTPELYRVGCTALVRRAELLPDGRYSLRTVGERRFVLRSVDAESRPYLVGDVTYLADDSGDAQAAAALVPVVQGLLRDYTAKLAENKALDIELPDLPEDPVTLSYLVAAAVVPDIARRQELLEAPNALSRLRAEQSLLRRELGLLNSITTVASPNLTRIPPSLN
ncbi:LON peptidase substrate-binding domain-containing protein [Frankia sp. AgB1.9]|uniref:LON peptidase substrate-binding domain-containing protein n=1 Tax=unclassified Frankia TaxID=2632575 RepID=UPI001932402F|nr:MULTISPECIES: LON peptidase substrate-binding domain-containing protein [unclassified Frankia]MBL7489640.1 LON peptidase substrate-binding domain-containing protein [Frankia sp. AgW1.1]MBL7548606.1 LON peptidase substrate-binding domain-containing protein [Frankia sp. AgB1.9]MBL7621558.1 LON peptidase substrate-binding domain-containing protein [Frankia sp. AgB1.8]